ncbi:MAG: hypothetical protein JSS87_08060 [Acidobacteria bacterium]|nr:hypothetical protein [Acidobacteriota bacterium]
MSVPETFQGWVAVQAVPLFLLIGFLGLGLLILAISARRRRHRMQRDRAGESIETFIERMSTQGFDPYLSGLVYTYLVEHEGIGFPVRPRDMLEEDLGLSTQQSQEMLKAVLSASGREYITGITDVPLFTVADVVRAVQLSPGMERLAA